VGLGTAYERRAIYRRILRWSERTRPASAAEGPLDGMAGMPGLHLIPLARQGVPITVILPSSAALERVRTVYARAGLERQLRTIESDEVPPDCRFDWLLAFNALPLARDWRALLSALSTRAERLALFVSHPWSYGTWIRRASRIASRVPKAELFDHGATRAHALESELRSLGRIEDVAWVDCPWWPDLFVEAGETLAGSVGIDRPLRFVYDEFSFPFTSDPLPQDLARRLRLHPNFETSRLAPAFAHHRAYLVKCDR